VFQAKPQFYIIRGRNNPDKRSLISMMIVLRLFLAAPEILMIYPQDQYHGKGDNLQRYYKDEKAWLHTLHIMEHINF
jgi:hypothetical protein